MLNQNRHKTNLRHEKHFNLVAKIKMTYLPRGLGSGRGGEVIKLSWFKIWPLDSIASIKLITVMFWNTRTRCRNESCLTVSARLTGDGVCHVKFELWKPAHCCEVSAGLSHRQTDRHEQFAAINLQSGREKNKKTTITLHGGIKLDFIAHLPAKARAACLIKPIDSCLTPLLWLQSRNASGRTQSTH